MSDALSTILNFYHKNHMPSWTRRGERGSCYGDFRFWGDRRDLSIDITESGPNSSKRVMIQLTEAETRGLYELLKTRFGEL